MLNKEIFKSEMQRLKRFYPNWAIDFSCKETMRDWYSSFEALKDHQFQNAVKQYVKNETFNPSVAGIMKHISKNSKNKGIEPATNTITETIEKWS